MRWRHRDYEVARRLTELDAIVLEPWPDLPLNDLLSEIAERVRRAFPTDFASILLVENGEAQLCGAAGASRVAATVDPSFGDGLVALVIAQRTSHAFDNLPGAQGSPCFPRGMASAAAAPMIVGGRLTGIVVVGAETPVHYGESDLTVLELTAKHLAGIVENARLRDSERRARAGADHARRHLKLLGDISRILLQSVDDYEATMTDVVDNAVDNFASYAAVFVADPQDPSNLRQAAARMQGETEPALSLHALAPLLDVMASGRSRLFKSTEDEDCEPDARPLCRVLASHALQSFVIAPIQVRGLAFGALLFATKVPLRGYRPSDRDTIEELGRRIALAAEATLLYREAQASEARTAAHLQRLRKLLDVWLRMAEVLDRPSILREALNGATRLLSASRVVIATDNQQFEAPDVSGRALDRSVLDDICHLDRIVSSEERALGPSLQSNGSLGAQWLAAPIRSGFPDRAALIVISENENHRFTTEDESLVGLLSQMTAAMLATTALHQESRAGAARLAALFSASPAPIVSLTTELEPVIWNAAAADLFGWTHQPTTEGRLPAIVSQSVKELAAHATGTPQQRECVLDLGGDEHALLLMLAAVMGDDGQVRDFILVATDETERRRLASEVARAQRFEAVGQLAGGVAHDFNNVLAIILGYAESLLRKMSVDDPARSPIAAIQRAGQRGADVTRQLLTLSRHQLADPAVIRPAQVCDDLKDMLQQMMGESVDVVRAQGGDDLAARVDRLQFEQALLNIAANARDAMPSGGRFVLTVAAVAPTSPSDGPWLSVSATDTGAGMDSATLKRCVEPLFTTKAPGLGTGLGLALVYRVAAKHGGDLRVESQPNQGTTVTLLFPAVAPEIAAAAEEAEHQPATAVSGFEGEQRKNHRPEQTTILLVDDDDEIRAMMSQTLLDQGFDVRAANSARQALTMLHRDCENLDLLITDVAMPHASGFDLARAVQLTHSVPVIFVSGYAERIEQADPRPYQSTFLGKPFAAADLLSEVSDLLGIPVAS